LKSALTGFYFSVVREGEVAAGDPIELLEREVHGVTVSEITRLYARDKTDADGLRRVLEVEALAEGWREFFNERLERLEQLEARQGG
jgi:MOSC domain-containing protein YiiM